MEKAPIRQRVYLKPLTWLLSYPAVWGKRLRIHRTGMAGIKPPYLLLCNHNAFLDFKVTTAAIFPRGANYVVAIDGFIGREWLLRNVGGICKRKFTNDISLVRHIRTVLHTHGDILALYPKRGTPWSAPMPSCRNRWGKSSACCGACGDPEDARPSSVLAGLESQAAPEPD